MWQLFYLFPSAEALTFSAHCKTKRGRMHFRHIEINSTTPQPTNLKIVLKNFWLKLLISHLISSGFDHDDITSNSRFFQ